MASHVTRRLFSSTTRRMADQTLKNESKRNPETMVRDPDFRPSVPSELVTDVNWQSISIR